MFPLNLSRCGEPAPQSLRACVPLFLDFQKVFPALVRGEREGHNGYMRRVARRQQAIRFAQSVRRSLCDLVLPHIVTESACGEKLDYDLLTVYPQQVTLPGMRKVPGNPPPVGTRGVVRGFSRESRCRMLRVLARLDIQQRKCSFLTLTLDGSMDKVSPDDFRLWRRAFMARLDRRKDVAGYIWRLEYQKRGAQHLHFIIWGKDGQEKHADLSKAHTAWHEIIGSNQDAHLIHGAKVDRLETIGDVVGYCAKYSAKEGDCPPWHQGRMWGIRGEKPTSAEIIAVPAGAIEPIRRVVAWHIYNRAYAQNKDFPLTITEETAIPDSINPESLRMSWEERERAWQNLRENSVLDYTCHANFLVGFVVSEFLKHCQKLCGLPRRPARNPSDAFNRQILNMDESTGSPVL